MERARGSGRLVLCYFALVLTTLINSSLQYDVQVQFDPQDYTVTEGGVVGITLVTNTSDYMFNFTVTLQYMDGSATAGGDYETGPYNVTFTAGQMNATVMVSTMDDNTTELSEYFKVVINSTDQPSVVEIGTPNKTVITIEDNDPAVQVQFQPQNYTVTEGGVVNVTLVTSTSNYEFDFNVTLQYMNGSATAGSDFTPGPYTVTFTAGQPSAILMVSPNDDNTAELSEYFTLMINSVNRPDVVEIGSPNSSVITIVDNDVVQLRFAPQNYTVTEGGSVNITLEAVPPSDGYDFNFTVTLQYMNGSAIAGYDYTPGPYTVTFTAGQMTATLMVSTMDDSSTELLEYFKVMINSTDKPSAVMIVSPSTAFIAIEDNDPAVSFAQQSYNVTEGGTVKITLVTTTSIYDFNFTVTLQYMNGSAIAGYDYTPGPYTVDFTAGQLYATLMVSTMDDNTTELSEYFKVMIISTDQPGAVEIGSPNMTSITIEDNDPAVLVWFDALNYTVTEGGTVNITLVTNTTDYEFDFSVSLLETMNGSATAGDDFAAGPYNVNFTAGQESATLMLPTVDDNVTELYECFKVLIGPIDVTTVIIKPFYGVVVVPGSKYLLWICIIDNDPAVLVWFDALNYNVTEGGTVNITLVTNTTDYEFDFSVSLLDTMNGSATAGDDFAAGPYNVNFTAGQQSATLMLPTKDDNATELYECFKVLITRVYIITVINKPFSDVTVVFGSHLLWIYIKDNDPAVQVSFAQQSYTITEGGAVNITLVTSTDNYEFDFTVTLLPLVDYYWYWNGYGYEYRLATADSDYESGPYTVTFTAGEISATLMVSTMDDSTTELSEYFKVVINSTDQPSVVEIAAPNKTVIPIEDNDPAVQVWIEEQNYTITEGDSVIITLATNTDNYEFDFTVTLLTLVDYYWYWNGYGYGYRLATAGSDYEAGPYTVTFTAGQVYATLTVSTIDDNTTELTEYFKVAINSTDQPSVVEIAAPNKTVIPIEDNDPAVQVQFDPQDYTVTEGGVVGITLVTNTSDYMFDFTVTLQYMDVTATAGSDYMHSLYNVSFTAGETSATLMVSTMDDSITELSENFVLVIYSTDQPNTVEIGSPNMAFITIEDNDPAVQVWIEQQNYTITEGDYVNITLVTNTVNYEFDFTVTLLPLVDYYWYWNWNGYGYGYRLATAGSDYETGPYTVTFTAGQMYATLMVPTMDDSTTELSEYFRVVINSTDQPSVVEIASPNKTVITIEDNDPAVQVQFDPQNYTVTEGGVVGITLVTNTSDYMFDFTVTLQNMDGTTIAGSDYEAGAYTVRFTAGDTSATLMVSTMEDSTTELSEYFKVAINSTDQPSAVEIGTRNNTVITIEDNDPDVRVWFDAQNYTVTEGGAVSVTLVTNTADYEFDFNVILCFFDGSATAGSDYTAGPDRVTFSPGQSSATFMVSTEEDDTVELSEYFILMIASVDRPDVVEIGSPSTSFITIEDNEPALGVLFAERTYTVTEGDMVNITLNLTSRYEFNFTVTLQYINGSAGAGLDYTPSPYIVTFTDGETSATLMVSTMDDSTTELSEYFKVVINSTDQPGLVVISSPNVSVVTIEDNEPDLEVFFDPTSYTVPEDMNVTLVLRVSTSDFSFPFTVTVNTTDITAVAEVDYVPGGYTVSFQTGQNETTLVIPTIDDNTVEIEESYRAVIVNTSESRVVIGSSDVANVTILDNEERPFCPPELDPSGLVTWPLALGGETANQPCPCAASQSNLAFRTCGSDGQWETSDLMLCTLSLAVDTLCSAMNVTEQLEVLSNISMMGNLSLTIGDAALLTETIDEVINSTEIDNATARVLVSVLDEVVTAFDEDTAVDSTDVGVRVLDVLDLAADAIPVTETPEVIVEVNVVVEAVARDRATLRQSGLTTTGLRGRNRVFLPAILFSLSIVPETTRFTAVSINNRNLIRPSARNNRLRSNIISVNLNTTEPLNSLTDDERIQLTFNLDTNTNDATNGLTFCVFYDTQTNDWSTEGCEMMMEDAETVTCACNHLTAFSVLQSPVVPNVSARPITALVIALVVEGGFVLLVLAVIGGVGAYLIWRRRRKSRAVITTEEL